MRQTSIDYFLALGLRKQQIIQEELVKPEPRFATLDDLIPFYERDYRVSQLNEIILFIDQRSVVLIIGRFSLLIHCYFSYFSPLFVLIFRLEINRALAQTLEKNTGEGKDRKREKRAQKYGSEANSD